MGICFLQLTKTAPPRVPIRRLTGTATATARRGSAASGPPARRRLSTTKSASTMGGVRLRISFAKPARLRKLLAHQRQTVHPRWLLIGALMAAADSAVPEEESVTNSASASAPRRRQPTRRHAEALDPAALRAHTMHHMFVTVIVCTVSACILMISNMHNLVKDTTSRDEMSWARRRKLATSVYENPASHDETS